MVDQNTQELNLEDTLYGKRDPDLLKTFNQEINESSGGKVTQMENENIEKSIINVKKKSIPQITDMKIIKPSKHKNNKKLLSTKTFIEQEILGDPDPWINTKILEIQSQDEWDKMTTKLIALPAKNSTELQQDGDKENINPIRTYERRAAEQARKKNKRIYDSEDDDDIERRENK